MDGFEIGLLIGLIGCCVYTVLYFVHAISILRLQKERKTKIQELLTKSDSNLSQIYVGINGLTGIGLDESNKKILLAQHNNQNNNFDLRVYNFEDVLISRAFVNNHEVKKTTNPSVVGRAVVGGVIAGPVGAVVGGVSAQPKTTTTVKKTIHLILVMKEIKPRAFSIQYKTVNDLNHWHTLMSSFIPTPQEVNKNTTSYQQIAATTKNNVHTPITTTSVADELTKLVDLCDKGILTQGEFENQKIKLLK